eukprot:7751453-Pyramimonas_sp.AAC.1
MRCGRKSAKKPSVALSACESLRVGVTMSLLFRLLASGNELLLMFMNALRRVAHAPSKLGTEVSQGLAKPGRTAAQAQDRRASLVVKV